MTDKVTILVEIGGKKYQTERKVTRIPDSYDRFILYREAIKGVERIFDDVDEDMFEEYLKKQKEIEAETSN